MEVVDFNGLAEHFVLVVVIACLVVGYIIKHATFLKWINNNDIPVILALFGAIINTIISGISVESIVYGAVMGLASTGLHQAFTKWVEKAEKTKKSESEQESNK